MNKILSHNLLSSPGCGAGYFGTTDECIICPKNTYNDEESANLCKPCPSAKWVTHAPGAVNASACVPCKELELSNFIFNHMVGLVNVEV